MNTKEKYLRRLIKFHHKDAQDDKVVQIKKMLLIQENPNIDIERTSSYVFPIAGVTNIKGPKTYYAKPHQIPDNAVLAHLDIYGLSSTLKLGSNNYLNLNKTRIVKEIEVECISNVNSDIQFPEIQKRKSNISSGSPISISNGYSQRVEHYRSNPGGFVGWNMYIINKEAWDNRKLGNRTFGWLKDHNEGILPRDNYFHGENPVKLYKTIILKKNEDLILDPKFDFFNSNNCSHVLSTGKQAISVSKRYFQYVVNIKYYEI